MKILESLDSSALFLFVFALALAFEFDVLAFLSATLVFLRLLSLFTSLLVLFFRSVVCAVKLLEFFRLVLFAATVFSVDTCEYLTFAARIVF